MWEDVLMPKTNTRVTVDIPTVDHKRLKLLAAYHGKSMREIFIELIEQGLEHYEDCSLDHTPNEKTKKALENVKAKKGLKKFASIADLLRDLED